VDADGDGAPAAEVDGTECTGGTDCDDGNDAIYPSATEGCELLDLDCDGDDTEVIDDDGDGWIDEACDDEMTDPGRFEGLGDCDDEDDTIYPGAPEGCDGTVDHDCDGDETDMETDADGDGYAPADCGPPEGSEDCDDSDASVHPGAEEICDAVDNDCDGQWQDGGADDDGDGYLDAECGGDDCDDANDMFHPAADVVCTSQDRDCNGNPDNDQDGDGSLRGTAIGDWPVCDPSADCDDADASIHPGAAPGCTTGDVNCNGYPDEDDDGDGYVRAGCGGDDCDDEDASVHPGIAVDCSASDDDCNGHPDEDNDGDGDLREACGGDDCDDEDASIHDGAPIDCSTTDHDCNGEPDDDNDGDGDLREACGGDDCDDEDASIHPGATEICDTVDQDCDGDLLDAPDADDDGDGWLDEDCGGGDCDDTDAWFHPPPPDAGASVCTARDFDCSGVDDALDTVSSGLMHGVTGEVSDVSAAWSGSEWGVVWTRTDSPNSYIYLAIVEPSGTVTFGPDQITSGAERLDSQPDIAWSEAYGRWGVVWKNEETTSDPRPSFQAFQLVGDILQRFPSDPDIPAAPYTDILTPSIASDGTDFGVVWVGVNPTTANTDFILYDPNGNSDEDTTLDDSTTFLDEAADIAWNAGAFGVAIARTSTSIPAKTDVYYDIVTPGASPSHIAEVRLSSVELTEAATNPSITGGDVDCGAGTSHDGFLVVWEELDITNASTLRTGTFTVDQGLSPNHSTGSPAVSPSPDAFLPSVAYNGDFFGVAWQDDRAGAQPDVFFRTIDVDGTPLHDEVDVSGSTTNQDMAPSLACRQAHFGIFWEHLSSEVWYADAMCWFP
jgi:hypothetical protein